MSAFLSFGDWGLVMGDWEKPLLPQAFFITETIGNKGAGCRDAKFRVSTLIADS
ncbi:MAG: hypothetical protein WBB28_12580 [Crinalium sp.]